MTILAPAAIIYAPPLQHDRETDLCWCNPVVFQLCPECDGAARKRKKCWRCVGAGMVDFYDPELASVTVHRDV